MSIDTYAVISLAVLAAFVGLIVVVGLRRRGEKCARCGRRLPRGASQCPACGPVVLAEKARDKESPKPAAGSVELAAVGGPLAPQRFPISAEGLAIGRHPDNDVQLTDEVMVSRHHAVIALEQGQYVLYDRDSANGTWVNEQRIFRHVLAPGDRIQIWQSQFVFSAPGAPLPPPPATPASLPTVHVVGEQFCGYLLEGLIGRGGMSEVFRARDANGKTVAIKILKETDPYLVTKFAQEGNKIGPLLRGHPNIVYVHEFGQSPDNRLFIVMEFVDAPSLRKSMRKQWTESEIVNIIGQVCSALAFAHENDVVHRDIKPENILLTADGAAKVLDFGIAKLTSASTVTRDKIVGTPEYISPEQARGEPVRPASDVYSLGIVLYEMIAGSVPFRRPQAEDPYRAAIEVVRQHLKEDPEPLRKRNPSAQVSARLEKVTMRALKKELKDRYATAKEMGQALGYNGQPAVRISTVMPIKASLIVLQGPRQGQRIPLPDQAFTLGRFELGSADTTISRRHASIAFRGDSYWLQDTSKNGTWVDNQRVYGEVPLRTGSVIVIGDSILKLEKGPL
jgi:serine/threonine protein kinase